jgi:large subunit ribosomal protein L25
MDALRVGAVKHVGTGKGVARRLRARGRVPAVFYGPGRPTQKIHCDYKEILTALRSVTGRNTILTLAIEGDAEHRAIIREAQVHPVKRNIEHCDFYEVSEDRKVTVTVPVEVQGKSEAEKEGGMTYLAMRGLSVRCAPSRIPVAIPIDVSLIKIGQSVSIADVKLPDGVEAVYKVNTPVVMGKAQRVEVVAAEAAVAEGEAAAAEGEAAAAEGEAKPGEGEVKAEKGKPTGKAADDKGDKGDRGGKGGKGGKGGAGK